MAKRKAAELEAAAERSAKRKREGAASAGDPSAATAFLIPWLRGVSAALPPVAAGAADAAALAGLRDQRRGGGAPCETDLDVLVRVRECKCEKAGRG
eukprot:gene52038-27861_t